MKTNSIRITLAAMCILLATACIKDPIYHTTNPDHGTLTLVMDWSERGEGIAIPDQCTVCVGEYTAELGGSPIEYPNLFLPGDYRAYLYNKADGVTISGNVASVDALDGGSETMIENMPGWLFNHTMDVNIEKDANRTFTAYMRQQVRQLTIMITPEGATADDVVNITALLQGVVGAWDLDTDQPSGEVKDIALPFSKITQGVNAGSWSATVRLLGITGTTQRLVGTIIIPEAADIALDSDLSEVLANFNSDKKYPFTISGQTVETHTPVGVVATITDWTVINDEIDVN